MRTSAFSRSIRAISEVWASEGEEGVKVGVCGCLLDDGGEVVDADDGSEFAVMEVVVDDGIEDSEEG